METAVSTEGARPIGVVATERPEGEIDRRCTATVSQCLAALLPALAVILVAAVAPLASPG